VTWVSPDNIKDLINRGRLKMNYEDYGKLYDMHVKCKPLWQGDSLTDRQIAELKKLDTVRAELHGKITKEIIDGNKEALPYVNYDDIRRGIAKLIEEDYAISLKEV